MRGLYFRLLAFSFLLNLLTASLFAQITKVNGYVKDLDTNEPIPFATVAVKGSNIVAFSNDTGYYSLSFRGRFDSISVRLLGYLPQTEKVKLHTIQTINFTLNSKTNKLNEVVVLPGENPAHRILRAIWKHKEFHKRSAHNCQYRQYNKIKISLSNIDEKFKQRKIMKPFQFVFDNIDTNKITGKTYLPVLISESVTDHIYQKSPPIESSSIVGSQISGIKDETILNFIGGLNQSLDFYNGFMTFYSETGFISPISDEGLWFYRYYLTDSATRSGHKCYHLSYKPRRKQERTFTGEFWVADTTFAITELTMHLNPEANVNFLSNFFAEYYYFPYNDSVWLLKKEHLQTDFNLAESKKIKGLQGDITTIYSDYKLGHPVPKILPNDGKTNAESNPEFWNRNRPVQLSNREEKIYKMVDSIKNVPAFRTLYSIISTIVDAHYNLGYFKIGPYFSLYSFNKVEGNRFRFGGTTNDRYNDKYKFTTYLAWGTTDKEFKYYGNLLWKVNPNPRICLNTTYRHDVSQVYLAPYEMLNENLLSSFLRRTPFTKLQMINNFNSSLEADICRGLTISFGFNFMRVFPGPYIPIETTSGTPLPFISTSEITMGIHFEHGQKFSPSKFRRKSLRNTSPAFDIQISRSLPSFWNSHYSYWKSTLAIRHFLDLSPLGFNRYSIELTKIIGSAPWPLLNVLRGNETYGQNKLAFNTMNYYEFVADQSVILTTEQHLQGLLFNYIPILRKLKLREVLVAKAAMGHLDSKNVIEVKLPSTMYALDKPYAEIGFGIENILKVIRIDAMWRLTHTQNPNIEKFGIRARLQFML